MVAKKKDIAENRASRNFDLIIIKRCLNKAVQASVINVQMMSDHNSSDLAPQRQMVSAENNTSGPGRQCQMMSVHISSGLVLHQMTSDHNRSELRIQDHSNEPSSSKLVPKVVPLVVKTATSSYSNAEDN
ncbi:hypothetical protein Tco_0376738, partial [Tanacetum coccineum]